MTEPVSTNVGNPDQNPDAPVNEDAMLAAEKPEVVPLTTEQLIDGMIAISDERREIKKREKVLIGEYRDLEAAFLVQLDAQGAKRAGTAAGTATITENILPTIKDWDALTDYIVANGATHLLQRRVSSAAFREMQAAGIDLPGVEAYIQRQISLRRSTS
jgi:hypothetical protein